IDRQISTTVHRQITKHPSQTTVHPSPVTDHGLLKLKLAIDHFFGRKSTVFTPDSGLMPAPGVLVYCAVIRITVVLSLPAGGRATIVPLAGSDLSFACWLSPKESTHWIICRASDSFIPGWAGMATSPHTPLPPCNAFPVR